MNKRTLRYRDMLFFAAVTWLLFFVTIGYITNLPEVRYSYETNECVEVKYTDKHTCEHLPEKYTTKWVE